MPTTKRPDPDDEEEIPSLPKSGASIQDKIAAFMMLDAMKDKTQAEKSVRLRLIGFSNVEIAVMLQTTPGAVATNIYQERGKKKGTKKDGARKDAPA